MSRPNSPEPPTTGRLFARPKTPVSENDDTTSPLLTRASSPSEEDLFRNFNQNVIPLTLGEEPPRTLSATLPSISTSPTPEIQRSQSVPLEQDPSMREGSSFSEQYVSFHRLLRTPLIEEEPKPGLKVRIAKMCESLTSCFKGQGK